MSANKSPLIITDPSPELIKFVREIEKRKAEIKKELHAQKDYYFPEKMI